MHFGRRLQLFLTSCCVPTLSNSSSSDELAQLPDTWTKMQPTFHLNWPVKKTRRLQDTLMTDLLIFDTALITIKTAGFKTQ